MNFHEKLKALTEDRKKRLLSVRAGLARTAISSYLSKGHMPAGDVALRIARVLNVSVEWLLDDAQGMPPVPAKQLTSTAA